LRKWKRDSRKAAHVYWKDLKSHFRIIKGKVGKAWFQAKVLPHISQLLKPVIAKALAEHRMNTSAAAQSGGQATKGQSTKGTKSIKIIKLAIKMKIWAAVNPPLSSALKALMNFLWPLLDKGKNIIQSTVCSALAAIPFVGGYLSMGMSFVIGNLWSLLKTGINQALDLLRFFVLDTVVDSVLTAILKAVMGPFGELKVTKLPSNMTSVATSAAQKVEQAGKAVAVAQANKSTEISSTKETGSITKAGGGMKNALIESARRMAMIELQAM